MIPEELKGVLSQNPNIMSGSICFIGTRIPVKVLLDNHREGVPILEFIDAYPDISGEQIDAVLDWHDKQTRLVSGRGNEIRLVGRFDSPASSIN